MSAHDRKMMKLSIQQIGFLGMMSHLSQEHCKAYSLFQKKRTLNSKFLCGPPWRRGAKIHIIDYRGATNEFGIKCVFLLE